MKLSEAIRLGAMMRPQGFLYFFSDGKSCALGAAAEAFGVAYSENAEWHIRALIAQQWPLVTDTSVTCPECSECPCGWTASAVVSHLNDCHEWTRERIAEWVETLESQSLFSRRSSETKA